eukprot:TRINITY_DN16712_c0_g1_i1.p1 TRINITY_DN16712_c0_g1~~TRINITY_DN16712_c0_g1_i1.p1  ORF type:complete len:147 (-),score=5.15 TRINITY_DN16712_c0_g1_i1:218-658(-)
MYYIRKKHRSHLMQSENKYLAKNKQDNDLSCNKKIESCSKTSRCNQYSLPKPLSRNAPQIRLQKNSRINAQSRQNKPSTRPLTAFPIGRARGRLGDTLDRLLANSGEHFERARRTFSSGARKGARFFKVWNHKCVNKDCCYSSCYA